MARRESSKRQHTSREVYDRIRWDERLDPGLFAVGYDAHTGSLKEVPFLSFVPDGDIPWHRIWYFREGEKIVWDRRTGVDLLFDDKASGANVVGIRWPGAGYFTPVLCEVCSDGSWQSRGVAPESKEELTENPTLQLLTWNVLDGAHGGTVARSAERIARLPAVIEASGADVIALQEVTEPFWNALKNSAWLQNGWWLCRGGEGSLDPHGVALLSRFPVQFAGEHRFRGARRALAYGIQTSMGPTFVVVAHLPSNYSRDAVALRAEWLGEILTKGLAVGERDRTRPTCVLLGDFNASDRELAGVPQQYGFEDVWLSSGNGTPGFTFEPAVNPLAAISSRSGGAQRLDRCFLRSGAVMVRAKTVELYAQGPLAHDGGALFVSDHWGLRVWLEKDDGVERRVWGTPVHQSALVWRMPDEVSGTIQELRKKHDRTFDRWPAHVSVLYGFVPEREFARASEECRAVCEQMEPFEIVVGAPKIFAHEGSSTVVLSVSTQPPGQLELLEKRLVERFVGCVEQRRVGDYNPHLTVGKFPRGEEESAGALLAWLVSHWKELRVPVGGLSLLAREEEGPFEEKHFVRFGRDAYEETLGWLETVGSKLLYGEEGGPAVVHPFGSFALRRGTSVGHRGDLDVLFFGPPSVDSELCLRLLAEELETSGGVKGLRLVLNSLVPRVLFQRNGISVDVCYARRPTERFTGPPTAVGEAVLGEMEKSEQRAIEGVVEAEAMRREAEHSVGLLVWLEALERLKRWAKKQGIYGNSWGYFGGTTWAVLLLRAAKELGKGTSAEGLLRGFFKIFSSWPWPEIVAMVPVKAGVEFAKARMPVLTMGKIPQNSARNVTPATARVLCSVLEATAGWWNEERELEDFVWKKPEVSASAEVWVRAETPAALEVCAGWLEGRAVRWVLALEKTCGGWVLPRAGLLEKDGARGIGAGVEATEWEAAKTLFRKEWEDWKERPAGATLEFS